MCQAISGQTGPNSRAFFGDVAKAFDTITDDSGPTGAAPALFVALLASIFAALAALAVWVELLIRSAGIYVCVLFFPVATLKLAPDLATIRTCRGRVIRCVISARHGRMNLGARARTPTAPESWWRPTARSMS